MPQVQLPPAAQLSTHRFQVLKICVRVRIAAPLGCQVHLMLLLQTLNLPPLLLQLVVGGGGHTALEMGREVND